MGKYVMVAGFLMDGGSSTMREGAHSVMIQGLADAEEVLARLQVLLPWLCRVHECHAALLNRCVNPETAVRGHG